MKKKDTIMHRMVNPFNDFMKHESYSLLSLISLMLYFAQMYFKLGWKITELMFPDNSFISILSSIIFSVAAMNITASIIINNVDSSSKVSIEFLTYDLLISLFFYGNLIPSMIKTGDYGLIGVIIFFSIFTARGLFHLSEQFRDNNVKRDEAIVLNTKYEDLLKQINKSLKIDESNKNHGMIDGEISKMIDKIDHLNSELQAKKSEFGIKDAELNSMGIEVDTNKKALESLKFNYETLDADYKSIKKQCELLNKQKSSYYNDISYIISEIDISRMKNKVAGKKGSLKVLKNQPDADERKINIIEDYIKSWESIFNKDYFDINTGEEILEL